MRPTRTAAALGLFLSVAGVDSVAAALLASPAHRGLAASSLSSAGRASSKHVVPLFTRTAGPVVMAKTPAETYDVFVQRGVTNAKLPICKMFLQSVMGGCYVGFGGLLSLSIAGAVPGMALANPGLAKFLFAALFPVNLFLVLTTGAQLYTGNSATVPAAVIEGKVTTRELIKNWAVSFAGNVVGCGGMALAATYCGLNVLGTAELAAATVLKKCAPAVGPTLVKAILCNWLVSLAVFLAGAANDIAGKMVAIWFPISTFVAIGLEHSVANMFILPFGLLAGAKLSFADVIFRNLIPVTIGNTIAGAFIVAAGYSYAFGKLGENAGKPRKKYITHEDTSPLPEEDIKILQQYAKQKAR